MDENELIDAVRRRAESEATRTDFADRKCPELAPPATLSAISDAEKSLDCPLHPLHRRLLREVANGGFGPGDGLIGVAGGYTDENGRSLVELRDMLWLDEKTPLPRGVVPLCDLGCGAWLCLDSVAREGDVLVLDEIGLTNVGENLNEVLSQWIRGGKVDEKLFGTIEVEGINPLTREPMTYKSRGRANGNPYVDRR